MPQILIELPHGHGHYRSYQLSCKCPKCRRAWADYQKARRATNRAKREREREQRATDLQSRIQALKD